MTQGLYDRHLLREFLGPLAGDLIRHFLVEPSEGEMPSRKFLRPAEIGPGGESFPNIRAVFRDAFLNAARTPSDYRHRPETTAATNLPEV